MADPDPDEVAEKRITELLSKLRVLDDQIEEAKKDAATNTEKDLLVRQLTAQRDLEGAELAELLKEQKEKEFKDEYNAKLEEEEKAKTKALEKDFPKTIKDSVKPDDDNKNSHARNLNMCQLYLTSVQETEKDLDKLLKKDQSILTQTAMQERELMIQTKINSIKQFAHEYRKHHEDIVKVAEAKQLKHHLDRFRVVMDITSKVEARMKIEEEVKKKRLALSKTEQVEGVKLEKFSGTGDSKYLNYYVWFQEFNELIMQKDYTDSIKLKFLKQYTEKDAHELVKNYHHGKELMEAFHSLDQHYGKPTMVIRESLRNLKMLEPCRNLNDVKANRRLLNAIKTNISTLKCYNFNLDSGDAENSTFLIEIEEKIPHIVYTKWEEEKMKMIEEEDDITIDSFIEFYTNLVNIEEKAQYVRKQAKPDDKSHPHQNKTPTQKALILHTDIKENRPYRMVKGSGNSNRKQRYGNDGSGITASNTTRWETGHGQSNRNRGFTGGSPAEGPSWPKYCIFCEQNNHNTTHCNEKKYTAQYKEEKCKKHNACFMCFRTTEHKAAACPKYVKCFLCSRVHHFNNHSRSEIDEYYRRNQNKQKRRK